MAKNRVRKKPAAKKPWPRITVRQVKAAYKKTGLTPGTGSMLEDYTYTACAIGAIHAQKRIDEDPYAWAEYTYGRYYTDGFISGFDDTALRSRRPRFLAGRADGIAARKAVLS